MTKIDYTGGDHSFKNWFKIMWNNGFIFLSILFLTLTTLELVHFNWTKEALLEGIKEGGFDAIMITVFALMPPTALFIVVYKGLYRYWIDLKNGTAN